jgi:putative transposase
MTPPPDPHLRHRFPAEIMSHAVWLYHVFSLSLRDVELIFSRTRYRRLLRDGATLRQEIRRELRRPSATSSAMARRQMAHGRGSSSVSRACSTVSGVPSTSTASCSTSLFRPDATPKRLLTGLQYEPRVIVTDKL